MYAIVRTGGKQYRAEEDAVITVDKLDGEVGDSIILDVLSIGDVDVPKFGTPTVAGASVKATIVEQGKAKKIDAFTYKAKKNVHKHWGHRQQITKIKVEAIAAG
jgi:large subunit ribosomal protein L21